MSRSFLLRSHFVPSLLAFACAGLVACGGDSSGGPAAETGTDGSGDDTTIPPTDDTSMPETIPPTNDSSAPETITTPDTSPDTTTTPDSPAAETTPDASPVETAPDSGPGDTTTVETSGDAPKGDTTGDAVMETAGDTAADTADGGFTLPTVIPGYTLTLWAAPDPTKTSADAIDFDGTHVWVAYQNLSDKAGADAGVGKNNSTIVEFSRDGKTIVNTYSVNGHVDGLRAQPTTNFVWVTSNEDLNPHLYKIDSSVAPATGVTEITLPAVTPQGGGLDDLDFVADKLYVAASNPAKDPNTDPALLLVTVTGTTATYGSPGTLIGNAPATTYIGGVPIAAMNLKDPDSITVNPAGELVLSSQDDHQLIFVKNIGKASQSVRLLQLTDTIDDTVWVTKPAGQLLVVDGNANAIYSIRKTGNFTTGDVYTEIDHHAVITPGVASLSLTTGLMTMIATGANLKNPTGMLFLGD